jgi:TonB-linked SusC/RagA family outer membrane protein
MRKSVVLLLWLLSISVTTMFAQTTTVTGKVTDDKGIPLAGASIVEKGSKNGVSAGADGAFSIKVKNGATLVISAVGYENSQVAASSSNLMIQLVPDIRSLNEVVVTGTGVATSRKKIGISVESITADKLPATPTASIDQALVGKIPGAQISSVDGTPGAKTNIILRGINTISGGTRPMILFDGVELGATDISSLDLSNIERVEVVQGAAAASIYGAQGANGVIQLFSKKGKVGPKTNIDFSTSYAVSTMLNNGNVHKAHFHSYKTDANGNAINAGNAIIQLSPEGTYDGVTWARPAGNFVSAMGNPGNIMNKSYGQNLKYYDQYAQLFQSAPALNNSLNISGNNGKTDFTLGFANFHQESNIRRNGYVDRSNFTSNIGTELLKGLKLRSITQLVYTKSTLNPAYGVGGFNTTTAIQNGLYYLNNIAPFYDLNQTLADGTYPKRLTTGTVSVNGENPFYRLENEIGIGKTVDIFQNIQLNYKLNHFVELDAKYGINHQKQDQTNIFKNQTQNLNVVRFNSFVGTYNVDDATGEYDNYTYTTTAQNLLATAYIRTDFQKDFQSKLPITTSTQLSYDFRKRNYNQYFTYGLGLPLYPIYNLNQTARQGVAAGAGNAAGDYSETFVTYGFLVNQKFDYGDLGGISAGFRTDYSSAFGEGSKPFTFPRGDAYLRPSSFDFWKNSSIANTITEWKLRAAYGEAGIQPGAFDRQVTLPVSNVGTAPAFSSAYVQTNPKLGVEVSKELEIGTDLTLRGLKGDWFSNLNFSLTYWKRKSENVIYNVDVAPSQGANSVKDNALFLSSNGIQASLNINVVTTKNFSWDFTTNFSKQTSQIDRINGPDIVLTTQAGSTNLVLTAGQKIGQLYGYKAFTSLSQTRKDGTAYIDKADYGKYQIVNGYVVDTATKGIQFTNEFYAFGDPNPKFNAAFINSFTYKNFLTFSFQIDWVCGSHLYNQTKEWMYRDGIHGDFDNPVTINGTSAAYVAYYRSVYADYFGVQNGARNSTKDYFYEDASFARLRNVSLAFDLARLKNIKGFRKIQLVLTGRNLFTITKYTGFDPEVSSATGNSAWDRGLDHNSTPNLRSYQLGLNIGL